MHLRTRVLISMCFAYMGHAIAADPPATTQAQSPSTPGEPSKPASSVTSSLTPASEAQVRVLRLQGYKPETRNGQTVYCRKEAQLGTRLETKTCSSAADLARNVQSKELIPYASRQWTGTESNRTQLK
jgi:hypothetical protein